MDSVQGFDGNCCSTTQGLQGGGRQCSAMAALQNADAVVTPCRALREHVLAQAGPEGAEGAPTDGMYHGMNNSTDYKRVQLSCP